MNPQLILRQIPKLVSDNAPAILTVGGVVGTVATAYLTGKATFEAAKVLIHAQERINIHSEAPLETKEKVKMVWRAYIPPVITGTGTVAAIVMANRISTKRAAALAAAYTVSEKMFSEYKDKVVEKFGDNKERDVRTEVAKQRMKDDPASKSNIIVTGGGEVMCYDMMTGRYFFSEMETIRKAMNDINQEIMNAGYASVTDFCHLIGLAGTTMTDEMGWNHDKTLDIKFDTVISDDGRPALSIYYEVSPNRYFNRFP